MLKYCDSNVTANNQKSVNEMLMKESCGTLDGNSSYVIPVVVEFYLLLWKIFHTFVWMSYENQYIYNGLIFESRTLVTCTYGSISV